MAILENLPPIVTLVLALLLVVWLVLALLVPFMIESIRGSTRRTAAELEELNDKLDRLLLLLENRIAPEASPPPAEVRAQPDLPEPPDAPEPPRREQRPAPTRKEPTISV